MSIFPLPVFEAEADPKHRTLLTDEEAYARLEPPKTIVVRFGRMKLVGEFPYDGSAKPGCGSKLVARTHRGTELVEMLTTTCGNSGCGKSISRKELLDYIENSGGHDYPFNTKGRILRVATIDDLNKQSRLVGEVFEIVRSARRLAEQLGLTTMKIVDAEPILGGEVLTFYYMSEERIDFRELVSRLAAQHITRIEMRQVGARDEARLTADYERCGQHCCCKNFLKVLKPISMRAAKQQKATLDPLKISGRCGRLMCCLRYEDQTYQELKANLPKRGKRVGTSEGPGVVVDGKILVQLVLVKLDHNFEEIAVPVEELMDPETCPKPGQKQREAQERNDGDALRGLSEQEARRRADPRRSPQRGAGTQQPQAPGRRSERSPVERAASRSPAEQQEAFREQAQQLERGEGAEQPPREGREQRDARDGRDQREGREGRRRRRRRGRDGRREPMHGPSGDHPVTPGASPDDRGADIDPGPRDGAQGGGGGGGGEGEQGRRRKRRRRRRRGGPGGQESAGGGPGGPPPDAGPAS